MVLERRYIYEKSPEHLIEKIKIRNSDLNLEFIKCLIPMAGLFLRWQHFLGIGKARHISADNPKVVLK